MGKQELIKQISIEAKIFNEDLAEKVVQALETDKPIVDPSMRFGLDIVFDKRAYQRAEFYQYPVKKEPKGPIPRTEQEKRKQKIYDVLSDQLETVLNSLSQNGYTIRSSSIIGDNLEEDVVWIILYQEEPSVIGKGKRQKEITTNSIMPDRPFLIENASKVLADIFANRIRSEMEQEHARQNHTPNWTSAIELFSTIATALSEDDVLLTAEALVSNAIIISDWPLQMRSRVRTDSADFITGETLIDYPEYILFQLNHGGSWELKKIDTLRAAQAIITKQAFKTKQTKAVVVLKNLQPSAYSLYAETDDGLVPVLPSEARSYKKLHVSWKNAT